MLYHDLKITFKTFPVCIDFAKFIGVYSLLKFSKYCLLGFFL